MAIKSECVIPWPSACRGIFRRNGVEEIGFSHLPKRGKLFLSDLLLLLFPIAKPDGSRSEHILAYIQHYLD